MTPDKPSTIGDVAARIHAGAPADAPRTIEQARTDGRAWADMTADTPSGPTGAWPGDVDDVRILPGYEGAPADVVAACLAAARDQWRLRCAEAWARRVTAATDRAERILVALGKVADRLERPVLVGVRTVQLPLTTSGLETVGGGPLLVALEAYSDGGYVARLPAAGLTSGARVQEAHLAMRALERAIVYTAGRWEAESLKVQDMAPPEVKALYALVRRTSYDGAGRKRS